MTKPVYFTICSKNYLAYALTLGRSLAKSDGDARFLIFLADDPLTSEEATLVEFEVIEAARLPLPTFDDMIVRYSVMELNTAIKPACFLYLFESLGADSAVYLDPDIYVLAPLEHVEARLEGGADLVLTPHSTMPLDDGGDPDDLRLLRTGVYNLGFAAFQNTPAARAFLHWWRDRLERHCLIALDDGIFVDQKWMDLAPAYLEHVSLLREPGYNAAYWNLMSRPVARAGGAWTAGGAPLHFFHFSGVVPGDGTVFSKHQNRYQPDDIGELVDLLHEYLRHLEANGHADWRRTPYAFAPEGEWAGADEIVRRVYRRLNPDSGSAGLDAPSVAAMCNSRTGIVDADPRAPITHLTYEIWASRTDLRRTFDLHTQTGRLAFNDWFAQSGPREYALPDSAYAHLRAGVLAPGDFGVAGRLANGVLSRRPLIGAAARLPAPVKRVLRRMVSGRALSAPAQTEPAPAPAKPTPELERSVRHYGYHRAETGLGQAARNEYLALRSAGAPVEAVALQAHSFENSIEPGFALCANPSRSSVHLVHVNADQTCASETWAEEAVFDAARYRIGYWAWELERFPQAWDAAFSKVDEVWTPSRFVADAVRARGFDRPVHVFPHCLPFREPADQTDRDEMRVKFALPRDRVLFLTAFDFNSFVERKNPMAVLKAFEQAAKLSSAPIGLVIKCHGGARHAASRRELMAVARRIPGVYIIDRVLTDSDLDQLFRAVDGLVSLHRSEGFGLTVAEAMSYGLACVATNYSGVVDFIDEDCARLVSYELVEVPEGAYPHFEGSHWAEPSIAQAAEALRDLAEDRELRARLGDAARRRVLEQLSIDRVGLAMAARLDEILDDPAVSSSAAASP